MDDKKREMVVAGTEEHKELLASGWRPYSAEQTFRHTESYNKGKVTGHNLKEVSELLVIMEKE